MNIEMTQDELQLAEKAKVFVRHNRRMLIERFVLSQDIKSVIENPTTVFMAGSPGAGKTEFSKGLIDQFKSKPLRIDPDEIREIFDEYNGSNSYIFHGACAIGVEYLFDYAQKNRLNVIMDGTFVNQKLNISNIDRCLFRGRVVVIYYIHQDPLVAWDYTQKRECVEGRRVPKEAFIDAYFGSKDNVNVIKRKFGKRIEVHLVKRKEYNNELERLEINIDNIDNYIKLGYNPETLIRKLK